MLSSALPPCPPLGHFSFWRCPLNEEEAANTDHTWLTHTATFFFYFSQVEQKSFLKHLIPSHPFTPSTLGTMQCHPGCSQLRSSSNFRLTRHSSIQQMSPLNRFPEQGRCITKVYGHFVETWHCANRESF